MGIFAGEPVAENVTLWSTAPKVQVTVPPLAIVTELGLNVLPGVVTVAVIGAVLAETFTVEVAVAVIPSRTRDAVIVADPTATAPTVPADVTLATDELLDRKLNPDTPMIALPRASRATGASCPLFPTVSDNVPGVTASDASRCCTVVEAWPVTVPLVAVIVALPLLTAVAVVVSPLNGETDTAAGALEVHCTLASDITACFESVTTADRVRVSPNDDIVSDDEIETATAAGVRTGFGGVPGPPSSPPPQALRAKTAKVTGMKTLRIPALLRIVERGIAVPIHRDRIEVYRRFLVHERSLRGASRRTRRTAVPARCLPLTPLSEGRRSTVAQGKTVRR